MKRERFWSRVVRADSGCWEWTGAKTAGYGQIHWMGRIEYCHRLVASGFDLGSIAGRVVMHVCDNPSCCNPDHLRIGSHADNIRDRDLKRRHYHGIGHHRAKLNESDVAAIRRGFLLGKRQCDLADEYSMSRRQIGKIVRRESWRHVL